MACSCSWKVSCLEGLPWRHARRHGDLEAAAVGHGEGEQRPRLGARRARDGRQLGLALLRGYAGRPAVPPTPQKR